jgi:hypothetical protein
MTDFQYNIYDWEANVLTSGGGVQQELMYTTGAAAGSVTDGTGLQGSNSVQAIFLKQLT